jgi:eukaryotic-like serine/threonine-protein kinase
MTLSAGTRLGPYEILAPLGAGGMGEVYRARDTRLERTLAIKVLPQHPSENAEVRQRFEREAKTISQLSTNPPAPCKTKKRGPSRGLG